MNDFETISWDNVKFGWGSSLESVRVAFMKTEWQDIFGIPVKTSEYLPEGTVALRTPTAMFILNQRDGSIEEVRPQVFEGEDALLQHGNGNYLFGLNNDTRWHRS